MRTITNPFGKTYLLVWRTESIFFTEERRRLSGEWNMVRFTSLPYPEEPNLINSSLTGRLPYPDNTFDAIYSFHVFEHLSCEDGPGALKELHRVLKPGGTCRISTPDLEFFAEEYLKHIKRGAAGTPETAPDFRYTWSSLNLIDQAVRKKSGGCMAEVLQSDRVEAEYLKLINGDSLDFIVNPHNGQSFDSARKPTYFDGSPAPAWFRWQKTFGALLRKLIIKLSPGLAVETTDERNRWLYDRISLSRLYHEAGFSEIQCQTYATSAIEGWERYNFDGSVNGDYALEPSLFMEGKK